MAKTTQTNVPKQTIAREDEVLREIRELSANAESGYMHLAELLSEAYHNRYYSSKWGYEKFNDFADEETNTGYRKAMQLIKVYDTLIDLGITDMERIMRIGWTKLRELIKNVGLNASNIDEHLNDVEKMTYKEVEESVKMSRDEAGITAPNKYTFKFTLGDDNGQMFNEAISIAKTVYNLAKMEDAISSIVMDWMQSQSASPEALPMEAIIEYVARVYGRQLVEAGAPEVSTVGELLGDTPEVTPVDLELKTPEPKAVEEKVVTEEVVTTTEEVVEEFVTTEDVMKMKKSELLELVKDSELELPADVKKVGDIKAFIIKSMESGAVGEPAPETVTAEPEAVVASEVTDNTDDSQSIDDLLNL